MVSNAASVGRSGVHDFILLRASAIVLAAYTLFMAYFFLTTPDVTYDIWKGLFSGLGVKVSTVLALVAVLIHAWIGIWQVLTDYVKPALIRGSLQLIFSVTLLAYFAAGLITLWGV